MAITKRKIMSIFKDLPEKVDLDELMYKFYVLKKIERGEEDIRRGRVITHEEAVKRISKKWRA